MGHGCRGSPKLVKDAAAVKALDLEARWDLFHVS